MVFVRLRLAVDRDERTHLFADETRRAIRQTLRRHGLSVIDELPRPADDLLDLSVRAGSSRDVKDVVGEILDELTARHDLDSLDAFVVDPPRAVAGPRRDEEICPVCGKFGVGHQHASGGGQAGGGHGGAPS